MFTILPITWESPDVSVSAEDISENYLETGGVFRPEEAFLVCNGNGTFSLYIERQFVMYIDETHEFLSWLPIRERNDE